MFEGFDQLLKGMFWALCVSIPLGIWKLIEIIVWLWNHVTIDFGG